MAGKTPALGTNISNNTVAYDIMMLYADILRRRGNTFVEHTAQGCPPVLVYDFDVIIDGMTLDRPVNYSLVAIHPPKGVKVRQDGRPYIIMEYLEGQQLLDAAQEDPELAVGLATNGVVAGRAGRAELKGEVQIQTQYPDHPLFASLVNPGQPIPYFITQLTGINDAMVRNAPTFLEIAGLPVPKRMATSTSSRSKSRTDADTSIGRTSRFVLVDW